MKFLITKTDLILIIKKKKTIKWQGSTTFVTILTTGKVNELVKCLCQK